MIVTLKLDPGSTLSESELVSRLKIGRTPVREALHRLAREGLVLILPRKGILVTEINPAKQLLALEVRRELERLMSRTAAIRATDPERKQFRRIAKAMKQASSKSDDLKFMRYDGELNQLVASASHNEYAARAMQALQGLSRRFWYVHYKSAADLPLCARLHGDLAMQIAEGSAASAAEASDRLLDYVEDFTKLTLTAPRI
ncbi:MAG: GntR family transcriptional regulator [Proteobacteria bacterium]|nr:MAG: GntR family transcriptional regulator [Pseudomonadota bacterium]